MSDFNYFEHAVVEKAEGKQKTSKLLGRLGLLAGCVVLFVIPLIIFAALAIISFILDAAIIFFFWKYFDRENVYTIEGSTITFSRTRGGFFGEKAGKKKGSTESAKKPEENKVIPVQQKIIVPESASPGKVLEKVTDYDSFIFGGMKK